MEVCLSKWQISMMQPNKTPKTRQHSLKKIPKHAQQLTQNIEKKNTFIFVR